MSEYRELSKLPADQAYWDGLEARITAELGATVRALPEARSEWWAPLATRAFAIGGLAAAAGLAALLLLPSRPGEPVPPTGILPLPDNPALLSFISAAEPPALLPMLIPASRSPR